MRVHLGLSMSVEQFLSIALILALFVALGALVAWSAVRRR